MEQIKKDLLDDFKTLKKILIDCTNEEDKTKIKFDIRKIKLSIEDEQDSIFLDFQDFDKSSLNHILLENRLFLAPLIPIKIDSYNPNGEKLFYNFLEEDKFDLDDTYESVIKKSSLYLFETRKKYVGSTKYIQTLEKNYIEICNTGTTLDSLVLVHELGHAKQNNILRCENYNSISSNFSETYSIFLELQFIEFLKQVGITLESINFNILKINYILNLINCLQEDLNNSNNSAKYRLKLLLSNLLALKLFEEENLNKVNMFLNNYGKLDDISLLKSIDMSYETLEKSSSVLKYYNKITFDRDKIK